MAKKCSKQKAINARCKQGTATRVEKDRGGRRRRRLSKSEVDAALKERHRQGKLGPTQKEDRRLYKSACAEYGTWTKALISLGLPHRIQWSRSQIIYRLQKCERDGVRPDVKLRDAARKLFGSLPAAESAAGVVLTKREWTRERVIRELQDRHVRGLSLVRLERASRPLSHAMRRLFGTRKAALEAAGFPDLECHPRRRWSREKVVHEIQELVKQGVPLERIARHDPRLAKAACLHWGKWSKAVEAAGFATTAHSWSKEFIVDEILRLHAEGRSLASQARENIALVGAAIRHFGCWSEAKREAFRSDHCRFTRCGQEQWSRERVISELRERHIQSESLSCSVAENRRLVGAAQRYFGGWSKAKRAAGVPWSGHSSRRRGRQKKWSPEIVVREIQRLAAEGHRIGEISKVAPALYGAAKAQHGSWRDAVRQAGFVPETRRWSRDDVIHELQSRLTNGESLSCNGPANGSLAYAAYRLFGSWSAAKRAAGVID